MDEVYYRLVIWDSCPGFQDEVMTLGDNDNLPADVLEAMGANWLRRYPEDIVMLVKTSELYNGGSDDRSIRSSAHRSTS